LRACPQGVLGQAGAAQHGQQLRVPGDKAFLLYDSYGFPLEITAEMAAESGVGVDTEGFEEAMQEQKRRSKDAAKVNACSSCASTLSPSDIVFVNQPWLSIWQA